MQHLTKNQVKFVRSLSHKKVRDEENVFVAEGEKCVSELAGHFETVLRADLTNATPTEIEQMSSMRTPQGVIAVFRRPAQQAIDLAETASKELVLVLDGVQDPGNLGTIIRTADWFGVRHIVCSPDTADCWNPKVVQATMGALARVQLSYMDLEPVLSSLSRLSRPSSPSSPSSQSSPSSPSSQSNQSSPSSPSSQSSPALFPDLPIYGTLLDGRNIYEKAALPEKQHGIIIMGNEGNGISDKVRRFITHPLLIPSYPADAETSESLNVSIATAVILAEFRRN